MISTAFMDSDHFRSVRTRAGVFISQQDEKSQPGLRELLKLSQTADELHVDHIRDQCDESLNRVLELHGLALCDQLAEARVLCECILNYALSMRAPGIFSARICFLSLMKSIQTSK